MYKVNEVFETIQGEGVYTGVPAVFLRLQGCGVGCAWCDTKHTWPEDERDRCSFGEIIAKTAESVRWSACSVDDIIEHYQSSYTAKHIVITGGEPCNYNLQPLIRAFETIGCHCQVETSGTAYIQVSEHTWVTVSPKVNMKGRLPILESALLRANEIKHPVGSQKDIDQLEQLLSGVALRHDQVVALQPISQKNRATELCIQTCIKRNWRLSVQTHKYINIA